MKYQQFLTCFAIVHTVALAWAAGPADTLKAGAIVLSEPPPKLFNRQISSFKENERVGFHLDERAGDGLGWWPDIKFANGTIEFDVRGTNVFQKSFVGVAFHGFDENTYDAIYFRPFNFRADDPARRSHGVQYIAQPAYAWNKLRAEHPDKYEREVSPAPSPNEWFHVRIVVEHPKVRVFVNNEEKPCLEVTQLSNRKSGWVGIWVGNGSGGDFANLKVTPTK
jgi:hypothetical protein